MKTVALISGGKDSCFNMMQCVAEGHDIVALANLRPKDKDELDSYMYQTVGHQAIDLYAEAMGLPLFRHTIEGSSIQQSKDYHETSCDEVEDLYQLLKHVKEKLPIEAVSVGAILSDYQRVRVEHVCRRLNLVVLAYLWRREQSELLQEMIQCSVKAIIIKVAALGLEPDKHLGMTLDKIYPHMTKMHASYGLNVCGEGGEYETFTLDCPLFRKQIIVDETAKVIHADDAFAPVAFLNFTKMHLEDKNIPDNLSQRDLVKDLPMKGSGQLLSEITWVDDLSLPEPQSHTSTNPQKPSTVTGQTAKVCVSNKYISITDIVGIKSSEESVEDATKTAMEQLTDVLYQYNRSTSDLLKVCLYVQDMNDFSSINSVYKKYFSINPPVRVCVQSCLPQNIVLQLDCVCTRSQLPSDIMTLHVQSLSHWAPANIGPYSQAKKIGSEVFVAGQIGLCPANLAIIKGGVIPETRLSLRHVARILAAMTSDSGLQDIITAVCYVTHQQHIPTVKEQLNIVYEEYTESITSKHKAVFDVLYAVVPSLPKSAQVEWQVNAITNTDGDWQDWSLSERYDNYTCQLTAYGSQSETDSVLSFIIDVDVLDECFHDIKENDILSMALRAVHKVLKHTSDDSTTFRVLRIFYRADILHCDNIKKAYHASVNEHLGWLEGDLPVASLIPVLSFENTKTVLSLYH